MTPTDLDKLEALAKKYQKKEPGGSISAASTILLIARIRELEAENERLREYLNSPTGGGEPYVLRDMREAKEAAEAQLAKYEKVGMEAQRLVNETLGCLGAFELELRDTISNTNYQVLKDKATSLETALAALKGTDHET